MQRNPTAPIMVDLDRPIRKQHQLAKSSLMSTILNGANTTEQNSHFIDSLERFKKDYAVYDKEAREAERQKRLRILEERKNQQVERESRIRRNQFEYDERNNQKMQQSRQLCELGLKKTGFSNGLPMNPITLQYHLNPFGSQQKYSDEEEKLRKVVRAHHIQNASTCGYNPINGQGLQSLDPLVPKNTEGRLQEKLGKFYETKRLNPNVDLGLNPKHILPKYVGEPEQNDQSPIKMQKWQADEPPEFQSSYQNHFSQKPHEILANSRMEKSNLYRHYMEQSMQMKGQKAPAMQEVMPRNSRMRESGMRHNNENMNPMNSMMMNPMNPMNPYLQDTAFQSQMYDMRR